MIDFQPVARYSRLMSAGLFLFFLLAGGANPALAGGWFKVAGGISGMAMDDVNNGDFRFYDFTAEGFNFPTLDSGFCFSLQAGFDLSPDFSLGFSWDRQHAHTEGTDVDVTADLNLDANFFMTDLYWWPLHKGAWSFGAAAGMGLVFPDGDIKVTDDNNVSYGEGDITGSSSLAFEVMALADWAFGGSSAIELTAGWRVATLDEIKLRSAPVVKEDGSNLELDYTGYIIKVGYKYVFGDGGDDRPDIN